MGMAFGPLIITIVFKYLGYKWTLCLFGGINAIGFLICLATFPEEFANNILANIEPIEIEEED